MKYVLSVLVLPTALILSVFLYTNIANAQPDVFTFLTTTSTQINLSWNEIGGATGYYLQYKIEDTADNTYSSTNVEITGTKAQVTGLNRNTEYTFRVRARRGAWLPIQTHSTSDEPVQEAYAYKIRKMSISWPTGMTSYKGDLYISGISYGYKGKLWNIDTQNSSIITHAGDLPAQLQNPSAMASYNGDLYIADSGPGKGLWWIDTEFPSRSVLVRGLPVEHVSAMAFHNGVLYVVGIDMEGNSGRFLKSQLWKIDPLDPDNQENNIFLGDLPIGITAMTSYKGGLYTSDGYKKQLWRINLNDFKNYGILTTTFVGDLPIYLSTAMTSYKGSLYVADSIDGNLWRVDFRNVSPVVTLCSNTLGIPYPCAVPKTEENQRALGIADTIKYLNEHIFFP